MQVNLFDIVNKKDQIASDDTYRQGLKAKIQLLKDEIEQGKIQLNLSKQIENQRFSVKNQIQFD